MQPRAGPPQRERAGPTTPLAALAATAPPPAATAATTRRRWPPPCRPRRRRSLGLSRRAWLRVLEGLRAANRSDPRAGPCHPVSATFVCSGGAHTHPAMLRACCGHTLIHRISGSQFLNWRTELQALHWNHSGHCTAVAVAPPRRFLPPGSFKGQAHLSPLSHNATPSSIDLWISIQFQQHHSTPQPISEF